MNLPSVVLLIGAILGSQALIWLTFVLWYRRRKRALMHALRSEVETPGEEIRRGPEPGLYCGATAGFSRVNGNGLLVLTNRRLLFQKLIGGRVEVPMDQMAGLREDKWFLGAYRSGRLHLILQLNDGKEVGFIMGDEPAWRAAMASAIGLGTP